MYIYTPYRPQVMEGLRQKAMDERLRGVDGMERRVR